MSDFLDTVKNIASRVLPERKRVSQIVVKSAAEDQAKARTTNQNFVVTPLHSSLAGMLLPGESVVHKKTPSATAKQTWAMYFEDDRVRSAVDSIGEDAGQRGIDRTPFSINFSVENTDEAAELKEHFEEVFTRRKVKMWDRVDRIARGILNQGSIYYRKIVSLSETPTIVEWKLIKGPRSGFVIIPISSDNKDIDGGYVQYEMSSRQPVNFFFWWEVDAFHWRFDEETETGLPLFSSATKNWDRLDHIDRTLATARNYHAFKRILNEIDATNGDEFERIVQSIENRDRQRGAQSPFSNYYTNRKASVLDQTMNWDVRDVNYAQDKLYASGMMPKGLYGSGGANINRAVLDMQTQRYIDGTVMDAESSVQVGLESFVATELYLMGKTPEMAPVEFVWPPKHVIDARMVTEAREAVKNGWLSVDSFLAYAFRSSFDRETDKRKYEDDKLAELAAEREAKALKSVDTSKLNSDADVEIDDDEVDDDDIDIESLLPKRNGRLRHIAEAW